MERIKAGTSATLSVTERFALRQALTRAGVAYLACGDEVYTYTPADLERLVRQLMEHERYEGAVALRAFHDKIKPKEGNTLTTQRDSGAGAGEASGPVRKTCYGCGEMTTHRKANCPVVRQQNAARKRAEAHKGQAPASKTVKESTK